jgi:uncharacterized protein with von Willebrand factor type A (vWA) domain
MKDRLIDFVDALRAAGVRPSVSETLDAAAAVAAVGVERPALRESLAAALVKDHADRPAYDEIFNRYFALPDELPGKKRNKKRTEDGQGSRSGDGDGQGRKDDARAAAHRESDREQRAGEKELERQAMRRLAQRKALASKPFRDMDPLDVEKLDDLVAELARRFRLRFARRVRRANRGRLDVRRTVRRALSRGGVPIELLLKKPRPRKSNLVALVDLSYSTATAAQFLLALLVPARSFFRRVDLFGYVDAPVEISVENGHIIPHTALDLNARSDFGNVLCRLVERQQLGLGRNTILLILGDARNNRRPPRADVLAKLQKDVRAVVWLNPEPEERWDSGDSVMRNYAPCTDLLLAAWNVETLAVALRRLARLTI